jgi:hypothetical protein
MMLELMLQAKAILVAQMLMWMRGAAPQTREWSHRWSLRVSDCAYMMGCFPHQLMDQISEEAVCLYEQAPN